MGIGACAAFISRRASQWALVPVQLSSAEELPSEHWCLCSLHQQKSFPVSIGACAAFISRRASQWALVPVQPSLAEELPSEHWCLCSLPQQKSFPVSKPSLAEELLETAMKAWKRRILMELCTSTAIVYFFPLISV